jgi:CDP-6-deoxy-D-xylo-4-hexulose-3-dehydrase
VKSYQLASSTWGQEEIDAIQRVIESGRFTMAEEVLSFERDFASHLGAKFAVMLNSGSSANLALMTSLRYLNRPLTNPGDEVIVPAVSWSTTYYPVNQTGCILKFVDIDPDTLNLDVNKVVEAISKRTRAILVVNLLGNPADWIALKEIAEEHDLLLIEDNCESLGAKFLGKQAGTLGFAGSYSSFFSHHISTMEGGIVTTDDEAMYHTLKSVRAHGWTRDLPEKNFVFDKTGESWDDMFRFVLPGFNLRPLEIEAAIGKVQLRKLDSFVSVRRKNSEKFLRMMSNFSDLRSQKEVGESSWFGFSIVLEGKLRGRRSKLVSMLNKASIESRPIVAGNFTRNPVIKHLDCAPIPALPVADDIHDNGLFVGNHHFDLSEEIDHLANVLEAFSGEIG